MADGSELKDELAVLGQHIQRFFVEDRRPWAEVGPSWLAGATAVASCLYKALLSCANKLALHYLRLCHYRSADMSNGLLV